MSEIILNHIVEFCFNVGKKAKFWHSSWLQGMAPRHLAQLFNLIKRKNKTVNQELQNNNWNRPLCGKITTATQLEEFISLCIWIQRNLSRAIDGLYSAKSAYEV
jgi:hypothetical protein